MHGLIFRHQATEMEREADFAGNSVAAAKKAGLKPAKRVAAPKIKAFKEETVDYNFENDDDDFVPGKGLVLVGTHGDLR